MSVKAWEKYQPNASSPSPQYPYGSLRQETALGMGDGTPLDVEWGNDFEAFKQTAFLRSGLVPSGNTDTVTNSEMFNAMQDSTTRALWQRSAAESGYKLVDGSFEEGGTLVNANDVLWSKKLNKIFSGSASTVVAGTNPTSGGFVDKSNELLSSHVLGRYAYSGKSIYDVLTDAEMARLLADDTTLDLTAKIQSLIDEQKPFYLVPNVRHYCNGSLQMKSGAKIIGAGQGTNQVPMAAGVVETSIVFNQATTGIGINLSSASGWVTEWAIDGVTLTTIDNHTAIAAFIMLNTDSAHMGCYNFKLHAYIVGARLGVNAICNFWNGDLDLRVAYCYRSFYKGPTGYSTSLDGWIKSSFCYHGVTLEKATYCNISMWYDYCGKSAPAWVVASAPADVLPVLLSVINSPNISGTIGVENSNAQWMNISAYSSINYKYFLYTQPANAFYKDPARISNVPLAQQSCIFNSSSQIILTSLITSQTIATGFPAASTTDPTYFYSSAGSGAPHIVFDGCYMEMQNYCICPVGMETQIDASPTRNGLFKFGATNINAPNKMFGTDDGILKLGTATAQNYHQLYRNAPYVDGETALTIVPATGASPTFFRAVNGAGGNAAASALRIPASSSTSRSINAGGTINASGADYAEYMTKAAGCGVIQKGDICGVTVNGEITDKFDQAISFLVKSTNPSFVGGDVWFTEEAPEPPVNGLGEVDFLCPEYIASMKAHNDKLEAARMMVDRIAFSGQVPVNVFGATPGDYIIPVRTEDGGIMAESVKNPSFDQYRRSVGQVWKVLDDGRAWVAVKIA